MAISELDRARIILDLIKDGTVGNEAPYANVDKVTAAIGNKVARAMYLEGPPILDGNGRPIPYADLTNDQKGKVVVNSFRAYVRKLIKNERVPAAVEATRAAEASTVDSEVDADLGTEE